MTARPDLTKPENMLALQGDKVLVYKHGEKDKLVLAHVMTLIRVIDFGQQTMRLVNREGKVRLPDWAFTQAWYDRLREAPKNEHGARWEITVKSKSNDAG